MDCVKGAGLMIKVLPFNCLLLLMISSSALADTMYPVITYICDAKADVIKIKNEVKWNEEGEAVKYTDGDEMAIFNPWDWVSIDDRPPRKLVRESQTIEKTCQLSSGIYKVIFEPHIFNVNALAKCGDRLSAKVTILRGGSMLLERQPLEEFCHGNAPVLRGVKVFGDSGKVKLYKIARHKFF